jgi:hypothetical protein
MADHADPLYAASRERLVTSNAWAFLHWLRVTRGVELADWAALQHFSTTDPTAFGAAFAAFAGLDVAPRQLVGNLALRPADGSCLTAAGDLPPDVAAPLGRIWPQAELLLILPELLLHTDLRPDDRVLVAGCPAWPWLAGLPQVAALMLAAASPGELLTTAADHSASVLVAPATMLAEAAFQRPGRRPNLAALRSIIATGGPLSPEARLRVYTWIKPDLMLLARNGETFWGNPLEPGTARPSTSPAFFTPRPAVPAPR